MKLIQKIALTELRYFLYSPIAWLVSLIMYIMAGYFYFNFFEGKVATEAALLLILDNYLGLLMSGYTKLFSSEFMQVYIGNLYLVLPLLTMGIYSREVNSGSIKLLYTSPVSVPQIILGKFLGVTYFNLILVAIFGLFLSLFAFSVQQPDVLVLISALGGILLIVSLYAAVGLFISCLTKYQIVAAILTIVFFYVLGSLSAVWQQYDFFRDVTFQLNFNRKADTFLIGIYDNSVLIYFLLLIALFLWWANLVISSKLASVKPSVIALKFILSFFVVVLAIYYITRPERSQYHDLTQDKTYEVHPRLKEIFTQLDGSPITVTLFTNILAPNFNVGLPVNRNHYIYKYWIQYINLYKNIKFNYQYYYGMQSGDSALYKRYPNKTTEEIVGILSALNNVDSAMFLHYSKLPSLATILEEDYSSFMELEYKGKKETLRLLNKGSILPNPSDVAGTLLRLLREKDVKISFLTGHYERDPCSLSPRNYGKNLTKRDGVGSLINQGVDVETLSIATDSIAPTVDLLVIADPQVPYSKEEQERINNYIDRGGNAIILGEPTRQPILNPILERLGVTLDPGILVNISKNEMPHLFDAPFTDAGHHISLEFYKYQRYGKNFTIFPGQEGAANISFKDNTDFSVETIYSKKGSETNWIEVDKLVVDSAAPKFEVEKGDRRLPEYTLAIMLKRIINGKEQRIIVSGDADILSNKYTKPTLLNLAWYDWCLNNGYPVYLPKDIPSDRFLKVDEDDVSLLSVIFLYTVPLLLLVSGSIYLIRRKRK